jgi:hypothetical protein
LLRVRGANLGTVSVELVSLRGSVEGEPLEFFLRRLTAILTLRAGKHTSVVFRMEGGDLEDLD